MLHGNTELQRLLSEWSNWLSAYQENTYFKLYPHLHQQLIPLSIFPINSSTILSRTYKVIHIQLLATACVYIPPFGEISISYSHRHPPHPLPRLRSSHAMPTYIALHLSVLAHLGAAISGFFLTPARILHCKVVEFAHEKSRNLEGQRRAGARARASSEVKGEN